MKKISILCVILLSFLFSQSQIKYLKGTLQGSQETPSNTLTGSGVVIVKYDMSTKKLQLFGDYAGLSGSIVGSHIHEGIPGVAGPNLITLANTGDTTGALSGTGTLTQAQEDSLLAGNMYANVHTPTNPEGELRAQLTLTTGQATLLSGRLQGAQEFTPNPSPAKGSVYALVDVGTTNYVYITGTYTGLTAVSDSADFNLANPGDTALNALFPLYHSFAKAGAIHAVDSTVSAPNATNIVVNGSYINIHTATYPNGEIRAQLVNNTSVRYLAGELNGANEVPANSSTARGTVIVAYNTDTKLIQLAGDYQNLSDTVIRAEIRLVVGGVDSAIIPLITSGDSTGTISHPGALLPPSLESDLLAGNMYVNVFSGDSVTYPNGEIRAQLMPTTSGETQAFTVNLSPTQEVPALTGAAAGQAFVIVDKTTGWAYATSGFTGINSAPIGAYIRGGAVGDTSGSIFLPLNTAYIINKKEGTVSGSGILAQTLVDSMINGLSYINILSGGRPTGAIRAQLGDLVLPVKLTYLNAYKQRNEVQLNWESAEELNLSRYEIQQLNTTNQQWITKGTVYANGGGTKATYSFNDVPNLYSSKYVMYRLKMIDKDGRITYSYMVKVNFDKSKAELFILTNPVVNGELRYNITGLSSDKKAEVSIVDYNGRLLLKNTVSSLRTNTLHIANLSSGMYRLVVRIDDTLLQKSFIK